MSTDKKIKIILVDDHKVIRDALTSYLNNDEEFEIIAEASNGNDAIELARTTVADIFIMDINMGEPDGIQCTKEIKKINPNIKILALTMFNESQHIKQMMNAGASGYLLKNVGVEEVKTAIKNVYQGNIYYSSEVTETVMNSLQEKKVSTSSKFITDIPLTEREKEVLQLIIEEFSNKEIANKLFISSRTVDAHKRNLLEKTNSKNIAGLVVYAINNKVFDWL
ncbi:MAG: response regulator transcription factor [Flavobacteriales bacterium]|nr:response regulator transcription factor [Flavobacteriales bacterium]